MQPLAFKAAVEAGDVEAMTAALAPDVVFSSPAVHRPYEGRDAVATILRAVTEVFQDFRYTDEVGSGDRTVLFFSARVGDRDIEGIDAIRLDDEGRVRELVVMIRPLSGLTVVVEEMGRRLAARPA